MKKSNFQSAPVHIFPIAAGIYDRYLTNLVPVNTVWGSTLAGQYPTQTPWQIFGTLYGNTPADIYAFQFATEGGSSWSHLQQFINGYLHESEGYRKEQIFGTVPAKPVTGVYNSGTQAGVMCVEYSTILDQPADLIYDCIHPYNYTAGELQAGGGVDNLPASLLASLNALPAPRVKLYVMNDITAYELYFNRVVNGGGHVGISDVAQHWSIAFADTLSVFAGDVHNYYQGTLVHEVGHQLDANTWKIPSGQPAPNNFMDYSFGTGAGTWGAIVEADKILFNQILTCMSALNDATVCSNDIASPYKNLSWYDRLLMKMGLYVANPTPLDIQKQNREMFTYMFQKRSGSSTFPFLQYVEGKFWGLSTPNMKNKMDSIWSTGHP